MTTRGHMDPRECPITACGIPVRAGFVLCPRHWALVPTGLRRAERAAYRAFNDVGSADAWDQYLTARAACLGSLP